MKWSSARSEVERLRQRTELYLPALTRRRGFSTDRVEYLLASLVAKMPLGEGYLEVGVLEGRTLEAVAAHNPDKACYAFDPCCKYSVEPTFSQSNVYFFAKRWQDGMRDIRSVNVGVAFYDGDHSSEAVCEFLDQAPKFLANEAIVVLDDWDRISVREGASSWLFDEYSLIAEMPEYTDGLTTAPHHFGYNFGVAVLGWRQ